MNDSYEKIIKWVKENASQTLVHLCGPATDDQIDRVESETGLPITESFRAFLKMHNGEDGETWLALLGNGNQLLSCEGIIQQYKLDQEIGEDLYDPEMETIEFWKDRIGGNVIFVKGSVKPLMLHPKWLPITCMNGDVFRYLDFDPADGGTPGQVIEVDPESCSYKVLASSFGELIEIYASELLEGKYSVDDEHYIELEEQDDMNCGVPDWLVRA